MAPVFQWELGGEHGGLADRTPFKALAQILRFVGLQFLYAELIQDDCVGIFRNPIH